ncbi:MAG TPA: glycosyltransferase [Stellaceae bacterium]
MLARFAAEPRVVVLRQENRGVSAARNAGVAGACSRFVAFLDADDELTAPAVQARRAALAAHPDIDVLFTDFWISDSPGLTRSAHRSLDAARMLCPYAEPATNGVVRLGTGFAAAYAAGAVPQWTVHTNALVIRRALFNATGGFDPGRRTSEDIDLWCRVFAAGRAALLPGEPDSIYFRWRGSTEKYEIIHHANIAQLRHALSAARSRAERRLLRRAIAREHLSQIYFLGIQRTPRLKIARLLALSIASSPMPAGQTKYAALMLLPRPVMRLLYAARSRSPAMS